MPPPFTNDQKRVLILQHLRPAFQAEGQRRAGLGQAWVNTPAGFDFWRREFIGAKVGKAGLCCCSSDDFRPIIAHCWDLRGHPDIAFKMLAEDPEANERRQVEWKIVQELEGAGLDIRYAATICRRQFKCSLEEASLKQLWCLFYTIRTRAAAKRKKTHPGQKTHA